MVIKNLRKALETVFDIFDKGKCLVDGVELDFNPRLASVTVGEWRAFIHDDLEATLSYNDRLIAVNIMEADGVNIIADDELYEKKMYPDILETLNISLYDNSKDFKKTVREIEKMYNYEQNEGKTA